jgi:pyruvate/2-oxoglutarate dehydrogenase complex dihydrolipoamide dehydrogenase (E3) component
MLMQTPPPSKVNERDAVTADLCILGAGPGGIALAIAAASLGQSVVLVEKGPMGGASLNAGSVPANALYAIADRAHAIRSATPYAITASEPAVDRARVEAYVRETIEICAPNASAERLRGLGVQVVQAAGRFTDPKTVVAGEVRITARRFVIATGASPVIPPLAGLDTVPYFTTDTVFAHRGPIEHLVVIGGGAAGAALAQAHRRLGARVTLVDRSSVLARFDPELAAAVRGRLEAEGVVVLEATQPMAVDGVAGRLRLDVVREGVRSCIEGTHLLLACGRRPAINEIGLDAAKIAVTEDGVKVNRILRTTNRRVFALGDVIGTPHSAHRAAYHAAQLTRSLLYRSAAAVDARLVPSVVHTDPELATVGLSEAEARTTLSSIKVLRWPLRENIRALANRTSAGHIKVITDARGTIFGAAIVAGSASDLIGVWALAISKGLTLDDMSAWVAPHPSLSEVSVTVARQRGAALGHAVARRWVRLLSRLG